MLARTLCIPHPVASFEEIQTEAAFSFRTVNVILKSCFHPPISSRLLLWYELRPLRRRIWSVAIVLLSLRRILEGPACAMWGKPSAVLSPLLSSSSLCQLCHPLSAFIVRILLVFDSWFPAYKWHLRPPYLISPPPSLTVLVSSPLHLNSPCIFTFILLHHFHPLPTFLLFIPLISSVCYSHHLCSLDQYSVSSSYHQALRHLTHLHLLARLECSVHPVLLVPCVCFGAAKCVLKWECDGWTVCSGGSREGWETSSGKVECIEVCVCVSDRQQSCCLRWKSQGSHIAPGASLLLPCLPHTPADILRSCSYTQNTH